MYIAFKWLFGLTLFMWLLMCSVDVFFASVKKITKTGLKVEDDGLKYKNVSMPSNAIVKKELKMNAYKISTNSSFKFFYYAIFCCAGFIISVFNKRKKLLSFLSKRNAGYTRTLHNLKSAAITTTDMVSGYFFKLWKDLQGVIESYNVFKIYHAMPIQNHDVMNKILLKRLKDLSEEKKNLSLLLAAANSENRNIKFNYQLESMAKRRLAVYMEENEKKRKECQSQYVNFQHLYLITHQENLYLHARIKRLTKLKEDAERNLISLVHEICLSKNEKLMAYCSRFVVQSKDKLLNSDMRAEIQKFLSSTNPLRLKLSQRPDVGTNTDEKKKSKTLEVIENSPVVSKAPKLVGLPGEHIWTVKDKDGYIEKVYEYDFTTDLDKGDTIRRIREYSVYHDKDCFLENISSRTVINDESCETRIHASNSKAMRSCRRIHNQRFLTGSEAFQLFLQNTQNLIVPVTASSRPPIFYG